MTFSYETDLFSNTFKNQKHYLGVINIGALFENRRPTVSNNYESFFYIVKSIFDCKIWVLFSK